MVQSPSLYTLVNFVRVTLVMTVLGHDQYFCRRKLRKLYQSSGNSGEDVDLDMLCIKIISKYFVPHSHETRSEES
jgi:hypothetical protein